jgi:hypothetical protein
MSLIPIKATMSVGAMDGVMAPPKEGQTGKPHKAKFFSETFLTISHDYKIKMGNGSGSSFLIVSLVLASSISCTFLRLPQKNCIANLVFFANCWIILKVFIIIDRKSLPKGKAQFSTVDLLIKIGCFMKKKNIVSIIKAADLNFLEEGGQLY